MQDLHGVNPSSGSAAELLQKYQYLRLNQPGKEVEPLRSKRQLDHPSLQSHLLRYVNFHYPQVEVLLLQ